MKIEEIRKKAQLKWRQILLLRNDLRSRKVIGKFISEGWLIFPDIEPYAGKINLQETIWVGIHVEPRILELLPAAYLKKKAIFKGKASGELEKVLQEIKEGQARSDFYGIEAKKYSQWINFLSKRKTTHKIFRFDQGELLKIANVSEILECTETEVIKRGLDLLYKTLICEKKIAS